MKPDTPGEVVTLAEPYGYHREATEAGGSRGTIQEVRNPDFHFNWISHDLFHTLNFNLRFCLKNHFHYFL